MFSKKRIVCSMLALRPCRNLFSLCVLQAVFLSDTLHEQDSDSLSFNELRGCLGQQEEELEIGSLSETCLWVTGNKGHVSREIELSKDKDILFLPHCGISCLGLQIDTWV